MTIRFSAKKIRELQHRAAAHGSERSDLHDHQIANAIQEIATRDAIRIIRRYSGFGLGGGYTEAAKCELNQLLGGATGRELTCLNACVNILIA